MPIRWRLTIFIALVIGAILLVSAFTTLISITMLYTVSGDGIARLMPSLVLVGAGQIIPLPLMPDGPT